MLPDTCPAAWPTACPSATHDARLGAAVSITFFASASPRVSGAAAIVPGSASPTMTLGVGAAVCSLWPNMANRAISRKTASASHASASAVFVVFAIVDPLSFGLLLESAPVGLVTNPTTADKAG